MTRRSSPRGGPLPERLGTEAEQHDAVLGPPAGRCGPFYIEQDASDEEMEALSAAVAEGHPEPGLRGDLCEPPCLILRPEPICDWGQCQPGG